MKASTKILIGLVTVGTLVGVAAAAGVYDGNEAATAHGIVWNTETCMPDKIVDSDAFAELVDGRFRDMVVEQEIRTGSEAITALMREVAPEGCKDAFPPAEGSESYDAWQLAIAQYDDVYQSVVDAIWSAAAGAEPALAYDPSRAIANAVELSLSELR